LSLAETSAHKTRTGSAAVIWQVVAVLVVLPSLGRGSAACGVAAGSGTIGSVHRASCACGFQVEVTVGGAKRTHLERASFPFYCEQCGLIGPNTAEDPIVCPSCRSAKVRQYGAPPVSIIAGKTGPVLEWASFEAFATENFCPACKHMTLVFGRARRFFS